MAAVIEADVDQVGAVVDHVALLVQPVGLCPASFVQCDLLHPAPQANLAAFGVVQDNVTERNPHHSATARVGTAVVGQARTTELSSTHLTVPSNSATKRRGAPTISAVASAIRPDATDSASA